VRLMGPEPGEFALTPPITFSDEEEAAAGSVLNKLYTLKCFTRRNNLRHGTHTKLKNVQKGHPPDKRGHVE
jgi:hypothetical protein